MEALSESGSETKCAQIACAGMPDLAAKCGFTTYPTIVLGHDPETFKAYYGALRKGDRATKSHRLAEDMRDDSDFGIANDYDLVAAEEAEKKTALGLYNASDNERMTKFVKEAIRPSVMELPPELHDARLKLYENLLLGYIFVSSNVEQQEVSEATLPLARQ
ncbi:uncharacterized protein BCR38DRAFT_412402 [Pseudomassariella vexata]|uniref:Uncharacterized protein n=1 Tax=Pseudomassariella vexata TaxID=1141098 RepID=A0A1Y2DLT1_9PEZI|nr:uncharacterized protein BCR38DRAFT_412402 [Pseudomassariella vexata]ORY60220.1 hypothetical protein BCR38DRAFT_412402 [Pseudomassariella vexata]